MLKQKLIFGLLVILTAIFVMGGIGVWILFDEERAIERVVERDFEGIKLINEFGELAAKLEAQYLKELSQDTVFVPLSEETYQSIQKVVEEDLERLSQLSQHSTFDQNQRKALRELEIAAGQYFGSFDILFSDGAPEFGNAEMEAMREMILTQHYQMAERVAVVQNLLEASVASRIRKTHNKAATSIFILGTVCLAAIALTFATYFYFLRRVIYPTNLISESLRKIQQQDFDQVVTVKTSDEFGLLASSFNDMSAELRVMQVEKEDEMARLNQERRAILDGFPNPVFILDNEGNLSQANPAAQQLMRTIGETGPYPRKLEDKFAKCLESGDAYLPEEVEKAILFRIQEVEYWYLPRIFRTKVEEDDQPQGWAIVLSDVSTVRFIDDMKSDLIGTVSHEVKTPLTSIRMVLHLLDEEKIGDLNEKQKMVVGSALDDCERLLGTLESLLQVSRLESGRAGLKLETVLPNELVDRAVFAISGLIAPDRLEIEVEDDLPPIHADQGRLHQVFANLLTNAIEHSPPSEKVTIMAKSHEEGLVRFSVIDRGEGLSSDEADQIFNRFYRAPGKTDDSAGLGLWIAKEIVKAHQGEIGIVNNSEETTEFYFEIPRMKKP